MKTLDGIQQGTPEWLRHRSALFNASDAPAMMSTSPYKSRTELLHEKHTGITPDIDAATQRRFDDGHRFEALARPLAEVIIGEELFPVTGYDGLLGASFDGITMCEDVIWEHKTLSDRIRAAKSSSELPKDLRIQMEQQLHISGAQKCLFMATKWEATAEQTESFIEFDNDGVVCRQYYKLIEKLHYWYEPDLETRQRIIAGWEQFEIDLAEYVPVEKVAAAVAAPIMDLPAIVITATGSLAVETNFARWGTELNAFIKRIPAKPETDQEFADCKAAVAALKKAEAQLDAEESRVLSMVPSIDDMKREKKLLRDLSSVTRLALEKLVVQRETAVKVEIMQAGKDALAEHIAGLNKRLVSVQLPPIVADFAAAIKSKRNLESMRGSVADLVAAKKIESSALADKIQINLDTVNQIADTYKSLFADFPSLVTKAPDDLALVIKSRIDAEDKRRADENERILNAEREKMRQEEEAKARAKVEAETSEKVKAEQEAKAETEPERIVREAAEVKNHTETVEADVKNIKATLGIVEPATFEGVQFHVSPAKSTKATQPCLVIIDRPTDSEIIGALAVRFSVSEQTVKNWLADMKMEAAA